MKTLQESGVLNFIAGFKELITKVLALRELFNPKPDRIKTENLQALLAQANQLQAEVDAADGIYRNAVSARKAVYQPIPKLATRINNAFAITDADANLKVTVKSITAKFRSSRKKNTDEATTTTNAAAAAMNSASDEATTTKKPKTHSTAQTGFDNTLGHLKRMVSIAETVRSYDPAETDLTITSIKSVIASCDQANLQVIEAANVYSTARDRRDDFLYNKTTGLVVIAKDVKAYVKSAYGPNSDIAKRILSIRLS